MSRGVRRITPPVAEEMRRLVGEGHQCKDVARAFGVSVTTCSRYTRNLPRQRSTFLKDGKLGTRGPKDGAREKRLVEAAQLEPLAAIAAREGISPERVRQVVAAWQMRTGKRISGPRLVDGEPPQRASADPSIAQLLLGKARLDTTTGCWRWQGFVVHGTRPQARSTTAKNYGLSQVASVAAYQLWREPEVGRRYIDPVVCGNPLCINPFHWERRVRV